jgi:predicted TIM-barrel fold metal-dependent hydrolase
MTGFQRFFSEAEDPRIHAHHAGQTIFFRWAVKELADFFGCEPAPESVLKARNAADPAELAARMFRAANLPVVMIDYGFGAGSNLTTDELAAFLPCRVERILRLETMAQDLLVNHESYERWLEAFTGSVVQARANGHVALKSIIAYRTGLAIQEWSREEARQAFQQARARAARDGKVRLADKPLNDMLVLHALEIAESQRMPIQFHTGFGDPDVDLLLANPLHLRPLLQSERFSNVPFVLLHASYPYTRELSYLASVYANVFMDLSLAIPYIAADIPNLVQSALSLAPTSKVLFSTDAYSIPEIFWIAARWGRWGIGAVLEKWLAAGIISTDEVDQISNQILHGNAEAVYGISL